jgi:hypothetical protein
MRMPMSHLALSIAGLVLVACQPAVVAATTSTPSPATDAGDAAVNQAIDQLLGDHTKYEPVIRAFQKAMIAHDAAAVAALVAYPLRVRVAGHAVTIGTPRDFIAQYDSIVTPAMAAAIGRQRYDALFVNYQGVMFGSGEAWINGICKDKACKDFDVKVVTLQPGASP